MKTYETKFTLEYPVTDIERAKDYLTSDNMTTFLLEQDFVKDSEHANDILHIEWVLQDSQSGVIRLNTKCELPEALLKNISSWIRGQNSDGLGEGFEQQDFANYPIDDEFDLDEDEYVESDYVMASFDWDSNEYTLELVGEW